MKNPLLNFIVLVASLAVTATGAALAFGQIELVTLVVILFGGFGLGATLPSFWARLRGVRSTPRAESAGKRAESAQRSRGPRGRSDRAPRGSRQRGEGRGSERKDRGDRRSRGKSRKRAEKKVGTVKWFDESKGYGFITPEGGGDDCFVHRSVVDNGGTLVEGKKVEFEITRDDRGRVAAANVVVLS